MFHPLSANTKAERTGAPSNVIDLMEALQKSLEQTKGDPKGKKKVGTA